MNRNRTLGPILGRFYKTALKIRRLVGRKKCSAFSTSKKRSSSQKIKRIFVINLDRQPHRLDNVFKEFSPLLDENSLSLKNMIVRVPAVDASKLDSDSLNQFETVKRTYTLAGQLYVDPCKALPQNLDLDMNIEMSQQEIAVALSHIETWKRVAHGEEQYALVLEDDICLHYKFPEYVENIWKELEEVKNSSPLFDILFLSFKEVDQGAEKVRISKNTFKLFRGIWYMSGYVLSKEGAKRLLSMLPVQGPVDLWVNHKFSEIEALMTSKSVIPQRSDETSGNFYSVLPILSQIGVLNDGAPSVFTNTPTAKPIFAIGRLGGGLTSLGMALSMLGYRCCSDLYNLPDSEKNSLLENDGNRTFDAYVNVGIIDNNINELAKIYPNGRLILFIEGYAKKEQEDIRKRWSNRVLFLSLNNIGDWKLICEFLGIVPPVCAYPSLVELGKRQLSKFNKDVLEYRNLSYTVLKHDESPWVISEKKEWFGLPTGDPYLETTRQNLTTVYLTDDFSKLDTSNWFLRNDTFPGNQAMFNSENFSVNTGNGASIILKNQDMKVREYSSGAITSSSLFLYGRFEAVIKPPKVSGLVTGIFLHRDSPRQEIDIEIVGKSPNKMLINVYYNPGVDGARFDFGYRGTPVEIDLGFDATEDYHSYAIEWDSTEIRWFVDGNLIYNRVNWAPTPIPHLPMKFHINLWPSISSELAGRIDKKKLPASLHIQSARVAALNQNAVMNLTGETETMVCAEEIN
ncbi:family 16 glycosylhydrolase [Photobacterium leiognathi]|uniref:family 16 glycosylhydrolase n=1 Tax=Photobacterium leiognathi TaxID=553611 RepID=UPI0029824494|nr:family 16 glycosylhydrolase [Photobacterium leiognathi]